MAVAVMETYATDAAVQIAVEGGQPNGCMVHKFGNDEDAGSLFDPTGHSEVKLKATNLAAGAACAVVLQQLRR